MEHDRQLQAFYDGALCWIGRWRVRRRLARDPEARESLLGLQRLGDALREEFASERTPDLWAGIAAGLPAPGERDPSARFGPASGWLWDWKPASAGLAAAALAAFLLFGQYGGGPAHQTGGESIRWLDSRGGPLMVLQDDARATIIWVPSDPGSARERS